MLGAGFNYALTEDDGNVAAGETLTVNASVLGAANTAKFIGTAESDGKFVFLGGAGDDVFKGGAGAIDAKSGTVADDGFNFIGSSAFSHTAGELRAVVGATTVITGDVDGNGTADFRIVLDNAVTLAGGDFVL